MSALVAASALTGWDESRRGAALRGPEKAVYVSDSAVVRRAGIPVSRHVEMELLGSISRMAMIFVCTLSLGACATQKLQLPMPMYVAVPAAIRNYVGTFQKLLYQLFADPEFQRLMATNP